MRRLNLILAVGMVCLVIVGTARAGNNITWTQAESIFWWQPGNWSGDANFYTDGDDVTINGGAVVALNWAEVTGIPPSDPPIEPNSVLIDTTDGNVDLRWGWGPWGQAALGSGTLTKNGPGTMRWWDMGYCSGLDPSPPVVYNINEGVWRMDHNHESFSGDLPDGTIVNLNGAEFYYNDTYMAYGFLRTFCKFVGETDFNVTADSNLRITYGAGDSGGWAKSEVDMHGDAGTTLTVIPEGGTFYLGNEWQVELVDDTPALMVVAGNLALVGGAALTVNATGFQTRTDYVLIDYTGYSQSGTFEFDTNDLPAGYTVEYAYNNGTQVALVQSGAPARDPNWSYWAVDGDGDWTVSANWDPNTAYPNAPGAKVRWDKAGLIDEDANAKTITLNAGETVTIGQLVVVKPGYTLAGNPTTSMLVWDGNGENAALTLLREAVIFTDASPRTRLDSNLVIDNRITGGYVLDLNNGGSGWDSNGHDIILKSTFSGGRLDPVVRLMNAPADANVVVDFSGYLRNSGSPNRITLLSGARMETYCLGTPGGLVVKDGGMLAYGPATESSIVPITITGDGDGSGALWLEYIGGHFSFRGGVTLDGNASIGTGGGTGGPVVLSIETGLHGQGDLTVMRTSSWYRDWRGALALTDAGTLVGDVNVEESILVVSNTTGVATGTGTVTIDSDSLLAGHGSVDNLVLHGELRPGKAQSASWNGKEAGSLDANNAWFMGGGVYTFEILDATGTAGSTTGWDLLNLSGALDLSEPNETIQFTVEVWSLSGPDGNGDYSSGDANNFDPDGSYVWQIIAADSVVGFDEDGLLLDISDFTNGGADGNLFDIRTNIGDEDVGLYLIYNAPSWVLGDVNADGNVDTLDISPFVAALLAANADAFGTAYPDWEYWAADVNEDGNVDTLDITPFVDFLIGGGSQVPEPATMALLGLGALGLVVRRRRRLEKA